jgi:hypothetical protein
LAALIHRASFRQDQLSLARDPQAINLAVVVDPDLPLALEDRGTDDRSHELSCHRAHRMSLAISMYRTGNIWTSHIGTLLGNAAAESQEPSTDQKIKQLQ